MVSLLQWFRQDWHRFQNRNFQRSDHGGSRDDRLPEGLQTYRFRTSSGERRVHLRCDPSGQAVLFVDVTDAIHLNATAAVIAHWALSGYPRQQAQQRLLQRHGRKALPQINADLDALYDMAEKLANPRLGCPTCTLGSVERQPLFSTPITAPYKADLAITYKCNNDCPHCYNEADRLSLEAMPAEDWRAVIDKLHQVGIPHLIFTGGEATLYRDLPALISHANSLGPICGLNTNGRRLADVEYARLLAQSGLNHVQITLGSHRAGVHDRMMNARCFQQTVQGIRNAQQAGLHTITNTTLMRMNAGEIVGTIEYLHDLGIRTFAINGMIYSGGGFDTGQAIPEEQMPSLLIRIRDRADELGMKFLWYTPTMYCRLSPVELEIGAKRCNAGEYSICVEPNADVLPCQSFYVAAGNVLRDPWEKIWHSPLFHSFRDRELNPQQAGLPEMCWKCPDLQLCGGGCRIEREAADGLRSSAGTGSGGCSTGGCSSGGCGGCGSSARRTDLDLGVTSSVSSLESGFVSIGSISVNTRKRRGSGVFAEE